MYYLLLYFFFSSRRRHTRCALVTGVQTCALPICRKEMHNVAVLDWVKQTAPKCDLLLSVCTGALILGRAGLLDDLDATTHAGALDLLRSSAPASRVHETPRFVDNGPVVLSAGFSAGIDKIGRAHL